MTLLSHQGTLEPLNWPGPYAADGLGHKHASPTLLVQPSEKWLLLGKFLPCSRLFSQDLWRDGQYGRSMNAVIAKELTARLGSSFSPP